MNNGDFEAQQAHFGYTTDEQKGKPEVREFISMLGSICAQNAEISIGLAIGQAICAEARLDESLIYQSIVMSVKGLGLSMTHTRLSTFSIFFVAFLLLVGIISGIATLNLLGETTKSYYIASVGKAILVSSAFNILMLAVSIMCAIWIFGILPLIAAILLRLHIKLFCLRSNYGEVWLFSLCNKHSNS